MAVSQLPSLTVPLGGKPFMSYLVKKLNGNLHACKPNIKLSKKLECKKKRRRYPRKAYQES